MFLVSKFGAKFADIESKIERICIVTGKASKLSPLVKKRNGFHGIFFNGWTPLQTASFNLHLEVVQYLLPESDPNATDEMGCTALHLAAWRGSVEITRFLIESATCDILAVTQEHFTILHCAVIGGHLPVIEYLHGLRNSKLLNEKSKTGYTALTLACKIGRLNIIQYLVEVCGMFIDEIDSHGSTPLHHSCWEGHSHIISYLLSRGANYEIQNSAGHKAIETCKDLQTRSYLVSCLRARLQGEIMPSTTQHRTLQPVTQFPMGNEREDYLKFLAEFKRSLTQYLPVGIGADGPILQISPQPRVSSVAVIEPPQTPHQSNLSLPSSESISPPEPLLQTFSSLEESPHELQHRDDEIQHPVDLQPIIDPRPTVSVDDEIPEEMVSVDTPVTNAASEELSNSQLYQMSSESITNEPSSPFTDTGKRPEIPLYSAPSAETLLTLSASSSQDEGDKLLKQSSHGRSFFTMGTRSFSFDFIKDSSESPNKDSLYGQPSEPIEIESSYNISIPFQSVSLTPILSSTAVNLSCRTFPPVQLPIVSPHLHFPLDQLFPFPESVSDNELSVRLNELILNISTHTGEVELFQSLQHRFPEALDPLLRNSTGLTPLHLSIMNQRVELALHFLQHGYYVSVSDSAGNTPLHLATFLEDTPFLKAVIEADSGHFLDINAQNSVGHTPLHIAAALGFTSGVRFLIEDLEANPLIIDHQGMNPFELAKGNGHSAIANYLSQFAPPLPKCEEVESHEIQDPTHEFETEPPECHEYPTQLFLKGEDLPSSSTPLVIEDEVIRTSSENFSLKNSPNRTKWILPKSKSLDSTNHGSLKVRDSSPILQPILKIDQMGEEDDLDEFISSFYIKHPEYKPSKNNIPLDSKIITGRTPPPPSLSTESEIAVWKFLGRAILEANAMEEETKQAMRSSFQQLNMNPQVALAFDMKAFTMLGALTRSYAKNLFHRVAQAFFIWKFLGITIPSFSHPILFAKHGYSLTSSPSLSSSSSELKQPSRRNSRDDHHPLDLPSVISSSRIDLSNPALIFALKILARYVSRCKHESEHLKLAMTWKLWRHLPSLKPKKVQRKENITPHSKRSITPRSQSLPLPLGGPSTPQNSSTTYQNNKSLSTVKQKPKVVDSNSHVTPNQPTRKIAKSEGRRPESTPVAMVPEIVEEEDLAALGALPTEITHILKLNEHVLWDIFSSYVHNRLLLPNNKADHKKKYSKRLLTMSGIWSLFTDFAICPTLCSKASLKNILDSLLATGQQPTVFYHPETPPPKIKSSEPIVSMNGFYKILWTVARDCLDAPAASDPTSRLLSVLIRMDGSTGRKKIASNSRASHMVSHFVLSDQAILKQQQSSLKADSSSSSRFVSPARTSQSTSQRSETKPVPNGLRSRSVTPNKRVPNSPPSASKNSTPLEDCSESMSRTEGSARPPRHQQSISSRIRSQSPKPFATTSPSPQSSPTPQQRIIHERNQTPSTPSPVIRIDTSDEALEPAESNLSFRKAVIRKSSTWSSTPVQQEEEDDEESSASPTTPQQKALDALAKAPVADRMNAKLAAKQFGALVKQFEDETLRNSNSSSPVPQSRFRERSGSGISVESNPTDGEPSSPLPSRLKRMSSFARRTSSSEKNYTESIWLREHNNEVTQKDSESNLNGEGTIEKNSPKILPPQPSPEDSVKIEKKQSALTLWRMSSMDGNNSYGMRDENEECEKKDDGGRSQNDDLSLATAHEREKNESQDRGEDTKEMSPESFGEGDWSPYPKNRKRRGTITRRR